MDKIAGHRANLKKKIYSQTQDSGENNTEFSALLTISCENCHNRGIHNERQRARLINTENLDCWSLWQWWCGPEEDEIRLHRLQISKTIFLMNTSHLCPITLWRSPSQ